MSVIIYWRERLENICPFYDTEKVKDRNIARYRSINHANSKWPDIISRDALYLDFLDWWRDRYVTPLENSAYGINETNNRPSPPLKRSFLAQIMPLLGQVKITTQRIKFARYYEGSVFYERKYGKFIELNTWQVHVNHFQKVSGQQVLLPPTQQSA